MKILKQIILMTVVVAGLSLTAMAQRDDNKNRPVKPDPPKIEPKDKPKDPPKDNNRPKKPQIALFLGGKEIELGLVR